MDWSAIESPPDRLLIAQALVRLVPQAGLNPKSLALASTQALDDADAWRAAFPSGPTEAVWFISQVSDASMQAAFLKAPAAGMAEVIEARFDQNATLKPFVRRIMYYDALHPFQALARMQRTARIMFACLNDDGRHGFLRLATLNVVYTGLVFLWLQDQSAGDRRTKAATKVAMRWLGL